MRQTKLKTYPKAWRSLPAPGEFVNPLSTPSWLADLIHQVTDVHPMM